MNRCGLLRKTFAILFCCALIVSSIIISDPHIHIEPEAHASESIAPLSMTNPDILDCDHYFSESDGCECLICRETIHNWNKEFWEEGHYECTRCSYVVHDFDEGGFFELADVTGYIQLNENYHYAVGVMTIQEECKCGAVNTRYTEQEPRKIRYYHHFENGVCTECGYGREVCLHPNVENCVCGTCSEEVHQINYELCACESCGKTIHTREGSYSTNIIGDASYAYYDGTYHWSSGTVEIVEECSYCGADIESTRQILAEDNRVLQFHSYESDVPFNGDKCLLCDYQYTEPYVPIPDCKHPNTQIGEHVSLESVSTVNDAYMDGVARFIEYEECCACGEILRYTGTEYLMDFRHEHGYIELQPECMECGYVPSCLHENYEDYADVDNRYGVFIRKDEKVHTYRGEAIYYKHCTDCGITFTDYRLGEDFPSEIMEIEQPHEFFNGACIWCGEEFVCNHNYADNSCKCSICGEYSHNYTYDSVYTGHGICIRCGQSSHSMNPSQFIIENASACNPLDDEYHQVEGIGALLESCYECGYSQRIADSKPRKIRELHALENGVCEACGYEAECTHESSTDCVCDDCGEKTHKIIFYDTDVIDGFTFGASPYDEYDDLRHRHYVRDVTYIKYDCGIHDQEIISDSSTSRLELHSFNQEYGYVYCAQCGYSRAGSIGCAHKNKQALGEYIDLKRITGVTETHEIGVGDLYREYSCLDCGAAIEPVLERENTELQKPHTFITGQPECADCGYMPSCTHENRKEEVTLYDGKIEKLEGFGFGFDPDNHRYTGYLCRYYACPDCGATHMDLNYSYDEIDLPHKFSGDVCTECGYEKCKHSYSNSNPCTCSMCWETRHEYVYDPVYTQHGFCSRCGQGTHFFSVGTETTIKDIVGYHQLNADYHYVEGISVRRDFCYECDYEKIIVVDTAPRKIPQAHTMENGACKDCGYTPECPHTNVVDCICDDCGEETHRAQGFTTNLEDVTYSECDDQFHYRTGTLVRYDFHDCFNHVKHTTIEENVRELDTHSDGWDSDGACDNCGYKLKISRDDCSHPNRYAIGRSYDMSKITEITPTHEIGIGNIRESYYCPDCCWDDIIGEIIAANIEIQITHSFEEGNPKCSSCGYISSCLHMNLEETIGTANGPAEQKIVDSAVDPDYHIYRGWVERYFTCKDCGATHINTSTRVEETELPHTFEKGLCTGCGYGTPEEEPIGGVCGENVVWNLDVNDGSLTIHGSGAMENYSSPDEQPWREIRSSIKKAVIDEGVTSVGDHAFMLCDQITEVFIADSVTRIGINAFNGCTELTAVHFQGSLSDWEKMGYMLPESVRLQCYGKSPLIITLQPQDQYVVEGQRAEFSVEATGDGLSYQWYINRNDGRGWKAIDGAIGNAYVSAAIDLPCDGFQYGCLITDVHMESVKSNIAALYVSKMSVVPPTGDAAMPLIWFIMGLSGMAGLCWIRKRKLSDNE